MSSDGTVCKHPCHKRCRTKFTMMNCEGPSNTFRDSKTHLLDFAEKEKPKEIPSSPPSPQDKVPLRSLNFLFNY